MIAVFYVVFAKLFERGGEDFISFLLLGVTAWMWFQQSVLRAAQSVRKATGLTLQVYVPKYVFPFSAVLFGFFKHILVMLVLALLLFVLVTPSLVWLQYFLVSAVQLLFITAISTILAALIPFIPDLTKVLSPLMRMTMFLSGIFYHVSLIPEQYVEYFRYNPMAGLIMEYRKVILNSQLPDFVYLGKVALYSSIILAFGLWLLWKFDRKYPRLAN
jgi:lipopolysaccharide transport system permease protein